MKTVLLQADNAVDLAMCGDWLKQGKLVAVPTETVYGLAADATNLDAVRAIFTAKGRPENHPLIVHVHDKKAINDWACKVSTAAYALAEAFWPGPLTLLLHKAPHVSPVVTGRLNTVGLRMPSHPVLLAVLQQQQLAVAAPSANLFKKLSPTSAEHVMAGMQGKISAVLDGGECQFGVESTIIDLTQIIPTIVRAGPISAAQIEAVLGRPVAQPRQHNVAVPGNVSAHYQPDKPLLCFSRAELLLHLPQQQQPIALLHYSETVGSAVVTKLKMPSLATAFARSLYQTLFAADKLPVTAIWCELPPDTDEWRAVNDRLSRASCNRS
ncbi:L-threonylcarbamoyladenylate synthase [Rheinheimera maricola]|uniref:Threonylcarbamoyl-AMP synthase n=1 Tax=Rheinheimera maricola TaxID=2793282 RepID=A0ABS7XC08_9GAMM|nr:L-threonylcarbamoyladenylate synthase [Rheinheimera maricola]MBZ9613098.1 threonylcarbamoyl-AMP synthase [Rheinheimera maricola]